MYIQFADSTEETIVSYFSCAQDPTVYPNQGAVATSDSRWQAFFSSLPPATQKIITQASS